MLKMMLVDDEKFILDCLMNYIDWKSCGVEVVCSARNGEDALRSFRQYQPDIVVTDIRMPVENGISLMQKIKQIRAQTEVILISGYQEFEYARAAIQMGGVGYLLKPIDPDELMRTVKKTVDKIQLYRANSQILEHALSREEYVRRLLYTKVTSGEQRYFQEKDRKFLNSMMQLAEIHFRTDEGMPKQYPGENGFYVEYGSGRCLLLIFGDTEEEIAAEWAHFDRTHFWRCYTGEICMINGLQEEWIALQKKSLLDRSRRLTEKNERSEVEAVRLQFLQAISRGELSEAENSFERLCRVYGRTPFMRLLLQELAISVMVRVGGNAQMNEIGFTSWNFRGGAGAGCRC